MPANVSRLAAAIAAAVALGVIQPGDSHAQAFPDRALRFFVPFPAGGSTDAVARAMQPALEKILGQPVVVENKAGAGGMLGVDAIAKAAPDGYTIGIAGAGALGVNIGERVKRPYDPAKDLAPISNAATSPFILVATPALTARSVTEVIKLAKAEPGRLSIGHGGNGTAMQLAALTFVTMADVKINLVPYRGTAPAVTDTIAGHVQLGIADPPPSMGAISDGKLKALAVSSLKRFSVFPDVPTFDELGLKDFDVTGWFGIAAPSSTPREIVMKLNAAVVAALKDPEVVRRIRTIGMEPVPSTPDGGIVSSQRFAGGPEPTGDGFVPNITGMSMSHENLVKLLETGETPDGDTIGGEMAKVTSNTAKLSAQDRAAMATYLKSLPTVQGPKRPESK